MHCVYGIRSGKERNRYSPMLVEIECAVGAQVLGCFVPRDERDCAPFDGTWTLAHCF